MSEIRPDTPASKAGLQTGDVIVRFAGKPVAKPWQLQGVVEESPVGSRQPMVVIRDGHETTLTVNLEKQPASYGVAEESTPGAEHGSPSTFDKLGLSVEELTPELAKHLGVNDHSGLAITNVRSGSLADQAGLSQGMVIAQVNRKPVKTPADLNKALAGQSLSKGILLLVHSRQGSRFVVLRATE